MWRVNKTTSITVTPLLARGAFLLYNDFIRNKHLMIEKKTTYKIEFTEEQVEDLYSLLAGEYHDGMLEKGYDELIVTYNELKDLLKDRLTEYGTIRRVRG